MNAPLETQESSLMQEIESCRECKYLGLCEKHDEKMLELANAYDARADALRLLADSAERAS